MNKVSKERLLEFRVESIYSRNYRLYVRDGKIIRIMCETTDYTTTFYPENSSFNEKCEIIIAILCKHKNFRSLKRLYAALEEGYWKSYINKYINNLIKYYEEGLAILKS